MRLLGSVVIALATIGAAAFWLLRPSSDRAAVNSVASNNVADQQAIDAANRDIENEERAAAAGLGGANNASAAAGNTAR